MSTQQDEITYRSPMFYDDLAKESDPHVHMVMIATKPDIIKQEPHFKLLDDFDIDEALRQLR